MAIEIHCLLNNQDHNLTKLCSELEVSGSLGNVCRQATITLQIGIFTKNFPYVTIPDYTPIWVREVNNDGSFKTGIFSGIVVDFSKTDKEYKITAFDYAYYLKRSTITKNFNCISAEQGTKEICNELGLNTTYLYPTGIQVSMLVFQKNAYDTIMGLYTEASRQTGEIFYLNADYYNNIYVARAGNYICDNIISPASGDSNVCDGNLLSIEYKETGSNLVNKVNVYDENNQLIDTLYNESYPVTQYGVLQAEYTKEEDKDYKTVVDKSQFHGIEKEIDVEILGDYNAWSGSSVYIEVPWIDDIKTKTLTYIKADTHTWNIETNSYTSKLTLVLDKNLMLDEKELEDDTKSDDDDDESTSLNTDDGEDSSTKVSGSKVVAYAKKFLGVPYVWGGTDLNNGVDCSGFVQAVYSHFGISIDRTTYDQMNDGVAVSTTDTSKWKAGDLIFPHSGHVVMYIGNGQVIHAPKTGDVVKISDVYFSDPVSVRRIL